MPLIFGSFWLIYHYNFWKFVQSHNIYSWHHIRLIYPTPISSKYDFLSVHRSTTPFLSTLIFVYETGCYVYIASIPLQFLTIQQIVAKYFSKIFGIYIPISVKKLLAEALKFWLSKFKYIDQVYLSYINVKAKLVGDLWHCKKCFRELNHLSLKTKLL